MNTERLKQHIETSKTGFDALGKVVEHACSSCGLCVSLCPTSAIEMRNNVPTLVGMHPMRLLLSGLPEKLFSRARCKSAFSVRSKVKQINALAAVWNGLPPAR